MAKTPQYSNLATKADIQPLKVDIQLLKVDIQHLEERIGKKLDKIANTLDGFVGRVDDLTVDNQVGANQIKELGEQVDEHEKRITKLESPQPL